MSKPFDATAKSLIEVAPAHWLELIGWRRRGPAEVINADLSTVTRMADAVIRVGGRAPSLVNVELQSGRDPYLAFRLLGYNAMLVERHRLPVRSVAVLLRPEADSPALTGRLTLRRSIRFQYDVIRVWQLPVERVLEGGLGILPMAPIADLGRADPAEVIRRMERRLRDEADPAEADLLWSASWVLMGLRFEKEFIDQLLRGVREMKESSTYQWAVSEGMSVGRQEGLKQGLQEGRQAGLREGRQAGLQEGRKEGLQEGVNEGKVEEARQLVLRLGGKWLGDPDAATAAYVRELGDLAALESIAERLRDARTWDDALGRTGG